MSSGPTREGMIRYMDEAAQIVASWPKWKREVLRESTGELMTDTPRPTAAKSLSEQEEDRTGPITHDEAVEIALRYNASHFRRGDREHARYTIPADPLRDDDIRLHAYIRQMRAMEADRDRLREELERAKARAGRAEAALIKGWIVRPSACSLDRPWWCGEPTIRNPEDPDYGAYGRTPEEAIAARHDVGTSPDAGQGERGEKA